MGTEVVVLLLSTVVGLLIFLGLINHHHKIEGLAACPPRPGRRERVRIFSVPCQTDSRRATKNWRKVWLRHNSVFLDDTYCQKNKYK